jgi:HSP20 family protein
MREFDDLLNNCCLLFKEWNKPFSSVFESDFKLSYPFNTFIENSDLYIEVPVIGLDKSEVKIEVDNDILIISSSKKKVPEKNYIYKRITQKDFNIQAKIDIEKFDINKIEANLDKGLLIIKIPENKESKSKNRFSVNIK